MGDAEGNALNILKAGGVAGRRVWVVHGDGLGIVTAKAPAQDFVFRGESAVHACAYEDIEELDGLGGWSVHAMGNGWEDGGFGGIADAIGEDIAARVFAIGGIQMIGGASEGAWFWLRGAAMEQEEGKGGGRDAKLGEHGPLTEVLGRGSVLFGSEF